MIGIFCRKRRAAENLRLFALFSSGALLRFGLRYRRSGCGELRRGDLDIRLHIAQLNDRAAIGPGPDHVERNLDSRDHAIVRVIDLRGNDAHGGVAIAHLPQENPRLLVEI